ncbi:imidazole glycerol phosphate synthase subunit HisF [Pseudogracilibacillus sp. ICA-222130]|uniref:imidazole glycerol phosphate synthase subunit HisF n=1 Tax=Pseudogracilibacillus sp. ICA-222130 TaxID=3134655 RepID=UPI0030C4BD78
MRNQIIPCLDIRNGRVVKGQKFENVADVADPVQLAKRYEAEHADTLFLLDIDGKDRQTFLQIVREIRVATSFPLYVGGGIRSVEDVAKALQAGATKVSITSAAIKDPAIIEQAAYAFGDDKIILSIDAKKIGDNKWHAFTNGGKVDSGLDVIAWAKRGEALGASEILLNSIDADGVKQGYDLPLNKAVANAINIPVIASGGAGKMEDFSSVLAEKNVQAALAASVFHYGEIAIPDLKNFLNNA